MKVLHLSSWFQPRIGYSELHLPVAMKRMGVEVVLVASDRYFPFPDYDKTVFSILGERITGTRTGEESGLWTHRLPVVFEFRHHLWLKGLKKVVEEFKPDLVITYQTFTLPTLQVAWLKRKFGFRLITRSSMEKAVFDEQTFARKAFYYFFTRVAAPILRRLVDRFTAVGPGACEIVARVLEVPGQSVDMVPLGADSTLFRFDQQARIRTRSLLKLAQDEFVVVYAGKLISRKDVHVLADAVSRLTVPCTLLLVGNGADEYKIRLSSFFAHTASPMVRVVFHDPVLNSQLPEIFSSADVAVWPSESSNAAIEAAMTGLPIVVSDDPGSRHYVAHNNGFLMRRGDAKQLAEILTDLGSDSQRRRMLGENGRKHFNATLSWEAVAGKFLEFDRQVVAGKLWRAGRSSPDLRESYGSHKADKKVF